MEQGERLSQKPDRQQRAIKGDEVHEDASAHTPDQLDSACKKQISENAGEYRDVSDGQEGEQRRLNDFPEYKHLDQYERQIEQGGRQKHPEKKRDPFYAGP